MPLMAPFILLLGLLRALREAMQDERFRSLFFWVIVILVGGTVFYHQVEGWSWLDAFYFTVITLTTVGYGDFSPATAAGKIFTVAYIFLGLGLLLTFIDMVAARNWERFREASPLQRLRGKKEQIEGGEAQS